MEEVVRPAEVEGVSETQLAAAADPSSDSHDPGRRASCSASALALSGSTTTTAARFGAGLGPRVDPILRVNPEPAASSGRSPKSAATAGGSIEPPRHVSESSLERKPGHAQPR